MQDEQIAEYLHVDETIMRLKLEFIDHVNAYAGIITNAMKAMGVQYVDSIGNPRDYTVENVSLVLMNLIKKLSGFDMFVENSSICLALTRNGIVPSIKIDTQMRIAAPTPKVTSNIIHLLER